MVCIYCGSPTQVVNSRAQKGQNRVWRRRKCLNCQAVVTTLEAVDQGRTVMVRYKSPARPLQPFSRDKLLTSVYESCRHRKSALEDASHLTDTIVAKLLKSVSDGVITSKAITAVAYQVLNRFDTPAAVHYQAYYIQ